MGAIRDAMITAMQMRNFSKKTITHYSWHAAAFVRMFQKPPTEMGTPEVKLYLESLIKRNVSASMIIIGYSALKFLYVETLHREWKNDFYRRPKRESRLPVVLSQIELKRLLAAVPKVKNKTILLCCYLAGLRVSEAIRLKVKDIDSQRMQIRVEQGKGKKDRYTILTAGLLTQLRNYWKIFRPADWLFPGRSPSAPLSVTVIQNEFRNAKKKPVF